MQTTAINQFQKGPNQTFSGASLVTAKLRMLRKRGIHLILCHLKLQVITHLQTPIAMFQVKFIRCQIDINKAFHYIKIILIFAKIL